MKVILLEDVQRLGHEGDIVEVAEGYMRNYLEPRGLAVRATKGAIKDLESRRQAIARREEAKRARAAELAAQLRERRIIIHAPTGEGTRLHGSVTAQQIAEAAREQLQFDLDRRDLDIPEPIREIGDYLVSAQIYKGVHAQLSVRVLPLDAVDEELPEAEVAETQGGDETAADGVPQEDSEDAVDTDETEEEEPDASSEQQ